MMFFRKMVKVSSYKSILSIIFEWIFIFFCFFLYHKVQSVFLLIFLIPLIATRMYAMYSLLHDGLHYLVHPNKKLNDFVSTYFLAYPLFVSFQSFRKVHLSHHKHLKTERDPESLLLNYAEFNFPMTKIRLAKIILLDLLGINFLRYKIKRLVKANQNWIASNLSIFIFHFLVVSFAYFNGFVTQYFLLWIVPYITVYQVLNRIRLYSEHLNIETNNLYSTRTLKLGFFQKFFLAPYNLGFHTEHHLYPGVPNYNLEELHNYIQINHQTSISFEVETDYFNLLKHMTKK